MDPRGNLLIGQFDATTGEKCGIMRYISEDGNIFEQTYKFGQLHGLNRIIYKNRVEIFLMRDGINLAAIQFDKDFQKMKKLDQLCLLAGYGAQFIKAEKIAAGEEEVRKLCEGDEENKWPFSRR